METVNLNQKQFEDLTKTKVVTVAQVLAFGHSQGDRLLFSDGSKTVRALVHSVEYGHPGGNAKIEVETLTKTKK